jgi:hypothetical protein
MPDRNDEIREPDNSTVDDWLGQRVERDTAEAERLLEETGDEAAAEAAWEQQAEKERPEDLPTEDRPAHGAGKGG